MSKPINELCIELIRSLNIAHGEPVDPFKFQAPGAKIVFQYSTQVLYLMVNFFWKGKMSDPDILYIAKPYKLDLVDLFSGAIRTQKWTLYLKTPPHYKLKHLYSTLPVQIPTPTRRGSHSLTLGTNDRSPTGEC